MTKCKKSQVSFNASVRQDLLTAIHSRTRDVVELTPPRKIPLANQILEQKSNSEPRRVVDACRRRDVVDTVQDYRRRDEFDPRVGIPPLPEPEGNRKE